MTEYKIDRLGVYHRPNGQFASKREMQQLEPREVPKAPVEKFDVEAREKKSAPFIRKRFAHTFTCTCRVTDKKYKTKIKMGKIKKAKSTDYSEYPVIKHYFTVSTNSQNESYVMDFFRNSHDRDYPNHRLINAEWTGWQETFLEE